MPEKEHEGRFHGEAGRLQAAEMLKLAHMDLYPMAARPAGTAI